MFETDPILWLQQAAAPMRRLMHLISLLGYEDVQFPLLAAVVFGWRFREGFLVAQVVLATALLTGALKSAFALPRPWHVDNRVLMPDGSHPAHGFTAQDASSFLGALPERIVRHYRAHVPDSYGFPSGHVMNAFALWGSLALALRRRWLTLLAVLLIAVMPLSRMMLGKHFLADVLGGLAAGAAVLTLAWTAALRRDRLHAWRERLRTPLRAGSGPGAALTAWLLLLPLVALAMAAAEDPHVNAGMAGRLLGVNAGFLVILLRRGAPDDRGSLPRRAGRVAVALALFAAADLLLGVLADLAAAEPAAFAADALATFTFVAGGVALNRRFGLYRGSEEPETGPGVR